LKYLKYPMFWLISFVVVASCFFILSYYVKEPQKSFYIDVSYVFYVMTLIVSVKFLPKDFKTKLRKRIFKYLGSMWQFLSLISKKTAKSLGFTERSQYIKGQRDESRFIFNLDDFELFKKIKNYMKRTKWKDLQTNSERVRFIYLRYILKLLKHGYEIEESETPYEILSRLKEHAAEFSKSDEFFDNYIKARYGNSDIIITDNDVQTYLKLITKPIAHNK
jgi:hypothetical protein